MRKFPVYFPVFRFILKIFLQAVLSLSFISVVFAAPYFGQTVKLKQPDGARVEVKVWGDEFYQDVESLDGYTLVRDPNTGWITYAQLSADGSEYVSTGVKYDPKATFQQALGNAVNAVVSPKLSGHKKSIRINSESRRNKAKKARASLHKYYKEPKLALLSAAPAAAAGTAAPRPEMYNYRVGSYTGLTLLIAFPDEPGTMPRAEMDNYLNQIGYSNYGNKGSVRDYFRDISSNNLDYTNQVTEYYTAQHEKAYYTDEDIGYGQRAGELVTEALDYLVAHGYDFSAISADADGQVIAVNALYAGPIDNAWAKGLWPHAGGIAQYYIPGTTKYFGRYQMTNIEDQLIIGVVCHENGHILMGWPDLYDYGGEGGGVGGADLMSGGNWNDGGRDPVDTNVYYRHAAGWADVTDIDSATRGVFNAAPNINQAYRLVNPAEPNESFYIENRRKSGRSFTMPGEGLTIWHVDWYGSNENEQMTDELHYLVSLEQADGSFELERNQCCLEQDDFFYEGNKTSFGGATMPDSRWWNGTASGLNILNISGISDNMSFELGEQQQVVRRLNLQVKNAGQDSCSSNTHSTEIRIVNYESQPIPLANLTVKMWFYSPSAINVNGCWGGQVNAPSGTYLGGVNSTVSSAAMQQECTVEAGRWANREVTVSFAGADLPANGGSASGMNLQLYRGSWLSPFDDNCNDYTKNSGASYGESIYVALYENGVLISEWVSASEQDASTGKEPCASLETPTFTATPQPSATYTVTITPTFTITPTLGPCIVYDAGFSGDGLYTFEYSKPLYGIEAANAVIRDASGRLVAAGYTDFAEANGDMIVWRLNSDGTPDTSFGGLGFAVHNGAGSAGNNTIDRGNDAAIDASGKIIICGTSKYMYGANAVLWRFNGNGSLDTSFNGTGFVVETTGYADKIFSTTAAGVSGTVYAAGVFDTMSMPGKEMAVWKFNQDGTRDNSFSSDGFFTHDIATGSGTDRADEMLLDSEGRLLIMGKAGDGRNIDSWANAIWRLMPDGTLDTTFNSTGYLTFGGWGANYDIKGGIKELASGKILAAGPDYLSGIGLWSFNQDGSVDTSFGGGDGFVTVAGLQSGTVSIDVYTAGRIIVAGKGAYGTEIHRFLANGSVDTSFNNYGYVRYARASANAVTAAGGKIAVAGSLEGATASNSRMAVWQYTDICGGISPTPTRTRTIAVTPTRTRTAVATPTLTRTQGIPVTLTATMTRTQAITVIMTPTITRTRTAVVTPTRTRTAVATATRTRTQGIVVTATATATRTRTQVITATYTRTVFATPTSTATTGISAVRVQYYTSNTSENTNTLYVNLRIINNGQSALALQNVAAKYWYTFEGASGADVVENDYSVTSGGLYLNPYVTKGVAVISQGGQNRVMTIGFTSGAGSIPAGGYAQLQLRIHKDNWSNYTQSTDYSFGTHSSFQDWIKATGYVSGVKAWGTEPGGLAVMEYVKEPGREAISEYNTYNYPNPCSESTVIRFSLSEAGQVSINISDLGGKTVKTIALARPETLAGINSVVWDLKNDLGNEVSNGTYIMKVEAEGRIIIKKIAVLK